MVVARHALLAGELKLVAEELAEHGYPTDDVPTDVYTPLQALAATTTTAAFAREQSLGAPEVAAAWTAADKAYESARELLSRSGRALLAFRGPALAALSEDEDATRAPGHREVVIAGRRRTTTQAAIIMAASGLVLCFAILAGGQGRGANCFDTDEAGHSGGFDLGTDREGTNAPGHALVSTRTHDARHRP